MTESPQGYLENLWVLLAFAVPLLAGRSPAHGLGAELIGGKTEALEVRGLGLVWTASHTDQQVFKGRKETTQNSKQSAQHMRVSIAMGVPQ